MTGDWLQDCTVCDECKPAADLAYVDTDSGVTVCNACNDRWGKVILLELPKVRLRHLRRVRAWQN